MAHGELGEMHFDDVLKKGSVESKKKGGYNRRPTLVAQAGECKISEEQHVRRQTSNSQAVEVGLIRRYTAEKPLSGRGTQMPGLFIQSGGETEEGGKKCSWQLPGGTKDLSALGGS